jgi:hypothetical protein
MLPAGVAAISILLIPPVGLFSSALLLGEPLGWRELASLALVVAPWRWSSSRRREEKPVSPDRVVRWRPALPGTASSTSSSRTATDGIAAESVVIGRPTTAPALRRRLPDRLRRRLARRAWRSP